jgi:cell division protein FtsB
MKTLSESLMDLAARVKHLEDSAAAVQERNRADQLAVRS